MKNILFRADSSSSIGTGHIMRDLVLAKQFSNSQIYFATQNLSGNINYKIQEEHYKVMLLESNDLNEVNGIIKKCEIDLIIIDSYNIDVFYEQKLKSDNPKLTIMVVDDTYERHHCDILLNHNIYAEKERYKNLIPNICELRCGVSHTLLRSEFKVEKARKKIVHKGIDIFIAMGGSDHLNLTIDILKVLEEFSNICSNVVTTRANQFLKPLRDYVTDKNNIQLHLETTEIAKLMNEADLAIISPSVIMNEVFYLETPFIAIKTADNQKEMYKYLVKNNHVVMEYFNTSQLKKMLENFMNV